MKMFEEDFEEVRRELVELGYQTAKNNMYVLQFNTTRTVTLGRCQRKGVGRFNIYLNKIYADVSSREKVKGIIMHEAIHSMPGCMNHQAPWKRVVGIVNRKYGYNIQRTADKESTVEYKEEKIKMGVYKYNVICLGCCNENLYQKKSKAISIMEEEIEEGRKSRYRCGICKSQSWKVESIR